MLKTAMTLLVAAGLTGATLSFTASVDAPTLGAAPPASVFTCDGCLPCNDNPNLIGMAVGGDEYSWIGNPPKCPNGIWAESCEDLGRCDGGGGTTEEDLQLAAQAADAQELVRIVSRPGVSLVPSRGAIQVMDCAGDHVAFQVPLEPDLLATVAQLQQQDS